ncbi:MAG: porin [Pseudomonadota bacterium]
MKKTLLASAVLMSMAGAANAQFAIYGLIDMCYGKSLYADGFLNEKADVHSGGDNSSSECNSTTRFGLKGTYEVAKGIKANFKLESAGIKSNGQVGEDGQAFFRRQAWAGFSGDFGEVRVGRQDSVPFQMMTDFDFNGASNGVSAGAYSGVGAWNTGRQSRSIQYIAPTMGGLSAHVGLRPKGNSQDGDKDQFSAAVKFGAGPVLLGAAVESKPATGLKNFSSIAGSYDFGPAKVMASYADGGFTPLGTQAKGYVLGVTAPVAGFTVGAHYGESKDTFSIKIKSWELFVNKEVFKNTYAYAEVGNWKGSVDGGEGLVSTKANGFAVGVIFVF